MGVGILETMKTCLEWQERDESPSLLTSFNKGNKEHKEE
jgi:hypothetical protein